MSNPVITVRNIGKMYRLGQTLSHSTLRDHIAHGFKSLFGRNGSSVGPAATKNLRKEFWALKDVSFDVAEGEVVGIIGRNGAGKSTLLKILSQITDPTKGEIRIRGRVASLLEVGTGFHPELTGRENIFLNGVILGMTKAEIKSKFDEIVDFSGVEEFLDTPVKRYSSGMYVRLAFAVAAHLEPEILVIDEVLAVGDAEFQKKCFGKMDEVSKSGRTILFVSHNMDAVLSLCNPVYVIEAGGISEALPPEDAIRRYLTKNLDLPLANRSRFQPVARPPIVQSVRVRGENGLDQVVSMGGKATFDVELGDFEDLHNVQCALFITNSRNQRIVQLHTRYHSDLAIHPSHHVTLACHVPSLPLTPGSYYVDVIVGNEHGAFEKIQQAVGFEVVYSDFLGYRRTLPSSPANIVLHCAWEILEDPTTNRAPS